MIQKPHHIKLHHTEIYIYTTHQQLQQFLIYVSLVEREGKMMCRKKVGPNEVWRNGKMLNLTDETCDESVFQKCNEMVVTNRVIPDKYHNFRFTVSFRPGYRLIPWLTHAESLPEDNRKRKWIWFLLTSGEWACAEGQGTVRARESIGPVTPDQDSR